MDSNYVYRGRIISVRVDKVVTGGRTAIREVVEHNGSAAILPLIGDKIVMERQYRHPAGKELFEIPAGTLEKDESPEECAARELVEETGYGAGSLKPLGRCYMTPGYCTEVIHFFVAENLTKVKERGELDEDEQGILIVTLSVADAVRMVLSNEIEDAKSAYAILAYAQKKG